SLSPVMHNRALAATGVNGAYLAFPVKDLSAAIQGLRSLGAGGISVTLPFKVAVMEHLDKIHESAAAAGAVNTIVNRGGELMGYDTDGKAAVTALLEKTPINGKTAVVIGAGGAARSIGAALVSAGARLIIFNRSAASGKRLARRLNAEFKPLSEFDGKGCHILVNATPVGMWPRVAATPVPKEAIRPEMVVMDIVYRPLRTRLLREAKAQGALPVDGVSMFVHQGARQFELWTGKKAPVSEMQQAVLEVLLEGEQTP
ncbi:MAG: shikimate dehydrogenase, partial [Deltaproteobacteria bacterium]|nr:shikimate dehydrogenase [Deltaproteobacteria bacterium]